MKKLIPFLYCFTITCSLLFFGCARPTDYESETLITRTPEELVANLSQAYHEKNVERYLSTLSEDCRFLDSFDNLWGKTQEQRIHQKMFGSTKTIELKLSEGWNKEVTETTRRTVYHYYLQVQLLSTERLEAKGQVELVFAKTPFNTWQINSFRELKTGLQKIAPAASDDHVTKSEVDYFPMGVGNRWTYEEQFAPNIPDIEVLVIDSVMIRGNLYYQSEAYGWGLFPISASFARQDSLHQLRLFVEDDSTEHLVFNLAAEIGDSLTFIPPNATEVMVVELKSHKDSLTVPAGTFKDVLEFLITDNNSGSVYLYEFAANIGVIRQRGTNQVLALKSAFVNGEKYPVVVGVETRYFTWTQIKMSFN